MRLEKWQRFLRPATVDRDQQDRDAVIGQRRGGAAKRRKLGDAGRAPGRPEIHQNRTFPEIRHDEACAILVDQRRCHRGRVLAWRRIRGRKHGRRPDQQGGTCQPRHHP